MKQSKQSELLSKVNYEDVWLKAAALKYERVILGSPALLTVHLERPAA